MIAPLDAAGRRRLHAGLGVLRKIFSATPPTGGPVSRKGHRTTAKRKAYLVEGAKQ
jgi:hypothetical protein